MARKYRIAISGHQGLPDPTARLVEQALRESLAEHAPDLTRPVLPGRRIRPDLRPRRLGGVR